MLAGHPAPDVSLRVRPDWLELFDSWQHPLLAG
jgi:hypothetical protein